MNNLRNKRVPYKYAGIKSGSRGTSTTNLSREDDLEEAYINTLEKRQEGSEQYHPFLKERFLAWIPMEDEKPNGFSVQHG
jgi:hypothetical protein